MQYDQFYIVNYLEEGKNWEQIQSEPESDEESEDSEKEKEDNWDEWQESDQESNSQTICLFCEEKSQTAEESLTHAQEIHKFDFHKLKKELGLDFYGCITLVNFIRRQVENKTCPYCEISTNSSVALLDHMIQLQHFGVQAAASFWKDPQYLIPTNVNDPLLFSIESEESDEEDLLKTESL